MLIAARNAFTAGGGWANPYVTDSLVAMWDGEWNVGGEVHDAAAETWVDLSGNGYDAVWSSSQSSSIPPPVWGDKCVTNSDPDKVGGFVVNHAIMLGMDSWTISICAKGIHQSGVQRECFCSRTPSIRAFQIWQYGPPQFVFGSSANGWANISFGSVGVRYSATCTQGDGEIKAYDAGSLVGSMSCDSEYIRDNVCSATLYNLFSRRPYYGDSTFLGDLYRVSIYSRVLTSAEIAANYAVDAERFDLPTA